MTNSVSYTLLQQLQILLASIGINAGISQRKPLANNIQGRAIKTNTSYRLEFPGKLPIVSQNPILWTPIRKLDKEPFSGKVYNLSIKNNPIFGVSGVDSHNCDWGSSLRTGWL